MAQQLSPLALAVLRVLSQRPMHPYELEQRLKEQAVDYVVKLTHGSLYHTVERLAAAGLIEPVETSRAGRRPERTVYALTPVGHDQALTRLRELLARPTHEYPRFAAALAFLTMLPPNEAVHLFDQRVVALEAQLAAHDAVIETLRKQGRDRTSAVEIEFCRATARAELDWVRALADDIRHGRLTWTASAPCETGGCDDRREVTP